MKTIALDISSADSNKDVFETIMLNTTQLIAIEAGGIALIDERSQGLVITYSYNLSGISVGSVIPMNNKDISDSIASSGTRRVSEQLMSYSPFKELAQASMGPTAVIPLVARGKPLGLLWIARRTWQPLFSGYDMVLLESICSQAAVAIDNLNLLEEQRFISESLQRGFLPERLPRLKNTQVGVFYASATTAATVGGDFYDAVTVDNKTVDFFVGDVSGKGVTATADAAMMKYTLLALSHTYRDPGKILSLANRIAFKKLKDGHFITLVYASYNHNTGALTLGMAGHPYPVLYSAEKKNTGQIEHNEPGIGIITGHKYTSMTIDLKAGDVLLLYSDGIIELRRDSEFFGTEQLEVLLQEYAGLDAQAITDTVIADGRAFSSGRLLDDIIIFALKRLE